MMKHPWNNINELIAKLSGLMWTQRAIRVTAGVALLLAALAGAWTLLTFVAAIAILPVWFKVAVLGLTVFGALFYGWRWALAPLGSGSIDSVAARLEKNYGSLKGRLIAAVQFQRDPGSLPAGTSPELVDLTAKQTLEMAAELALENSLDYQSVKKSLKPLAAAAAVVAAVILLAPGYYTHALTVYSSPLEEIAPPLGYQLSANPAGGKAIRYRDLELSGHLAGTGFPRQATINFRYQGGAWQSREFSLRDLPSTQTESGESLTFSANLREVKRSLEFYAEAGRRRTQVTKIEVVDLPRVSDISVSIVSPEYTNLPPLEIDENNGSFAAVVGSHARLGIVSNVDLSEAQLIFDDGEIVELATAGARLSADMTVTTNRGYHLRLVDALGEENPDPIEYYVTAIEDRAPQVTVVVPGVDTDLDESMYLPLRVSISDDFGFSTLVMKYHIVSDGKESEEVVTVIHFSDNIKTDGNVEFRWDVSETGIEPGGYIAYYFEIWDNDGYSGPKEGRSRIYHARLPSIEELIAELDSESENRIEATERILEKERELYDKLQDSQRKLRELKDGEKLDWQKQKNLEELIQQNQELMNEMEKLAENMDRSLDQREGSKLLNQEMMEKLRRIQELYDEVATDEMRDAQKKLQEALANMDPDLLQEAMEDYELSQEEMLNRLERTLALLKQMQIEQKINEMTEAAKELLDRQIANNEKTEEADDAALPDLAKEEDKIEKSMQELKKQASELEELLRDAQMDDIPEAREFADAVKRSEADQDMRDMSRSLKSQDKGGSSESGEGAEEKLQEMLDSMREQQQAMSGNQARKMNAAIRRAIEDATYLSGTQEEALEKTREITPHSSALRELADQQVMLKESVGGFGQRIVTLSASNPFLSSDLRTLISDALNEIDESVEHLGQTRGPAAATAERNAMMKLNEVAIRLLESMDDQSQCNKGGSCDKAGQKMESLSEKQKRLNRETERQLGMPKTPGQNPNAGELERLRELAGEQRAIQRSLEELEQEFGSRDQILGDLDALGKEMEKVIEELSEGQAGGPTTERQLRIHSRMLESIKALNRRDFTPERRARVGDEFFRASPGPLFDGADQRPFEDRLQDFLKEGFPPEYEQQVRNYFKALNKLNGSGK